MQIKNVLLGEITPYENNPRNNDDAVEYVANSIKEFGFKVPIVVDSHGTIIAGHTRYKAALKLGLVTVPVVFADDLTEEQARAYRLADNKVSEIATWDYGSLDIELEEIEFFNMEEFGFVDLSQSENDEFIDMDVSGAGEKESSLHKITVDGRSFNITEEEASLFVDAIEEYIDENGVSFGFIRGLIND